MHGRSGVNVRASAEAGNRPVIGESTRWHLILELDAKQCLLKLYHVQAQGHIVHRAGIVFGAIGQYGVGAHAHVQAVKKREIATSLFRRQGMVSFVNQPHARKWCPVTQLLVQPMDVLMGSGKIGPTGGCVPHLAVAVSCGVQEALQSRPVHVVHL